MNQKRYRWWVIFLVIAWVFLFFLQKTNLAASDLGRHIKNGEIILSTGKVFSTNLYSYTNPDFYAPNHHWLFGVISYLVHKTFGFAGLTLLGAVLYTAAVALSWWQSFKNSSLISSVIATLAAIPLVAHRSETRPEAFSLFFFALIWFWLRNWTAIKSKSIWAAYVVPLVVMALWINIHIFFILAVPLIGAALLQNVFRKKIKASYSLLVLSVGMFLAGFLNPFGLTLLLYPFQIFSNYGYRVAENQPLWFFLRHFTQTYHWYLFAYIVLTSLCLLYIWWQSKKYSWYTTVLFVFFAGFTAKLIRMENIFAIVSIPVLADAIFLFWKNHHSVLRSFIKTSTGLMVTSVTGFALVAILFGTGLFMPFNTGFGLGLYPKYDQSIEFVKNLPITGPIFNNFDSGSFLIYSLYPTQKVFIDNRAEAYPDSFLKNSYLAAQENEEVWTELENQYHFQAIIFYRLEQTNWGQEFLVKRFRDPSWVPIYVDNYLLILLKDNKENKQVIDQYRLPNEMFTIK